MEKIDILIDLINDTQSFFKQQIQKQVNIGLTLRNWLFGFYLAYPYILRSAIAKSYLINFKQLNSKGKYYQY